MKKALVFGANGQAGSYLCELLLSLGYIVTGVMKNQAPGKNLLGCMKYQKFIPWVCSSVTNDFQVREVIDAQQPDEVYNMTGKMFAPDSWKDPTGYLDVNGRAVATILDALSLGHGKVKFFNAGSASVFAPSTGPLSEGSRRDPLDPYGWAKYFAEGLVKAYREKHGMFACTGIFFNMESPRRPRTFFAQKVAYEVVRMKRIIEDGKPIDRVRFGKLKAIRDWGGAKDYVRAVVDMMQASAPQDYVIGSGLSYSCLEFVKEALNVAGLGHRGLELIDFDTAEEPANVMRCDPRKLYIMLGWKAQSNMYSVVTDLVLAEMGRQREEEIAQSAASG